MQQNTNGDKAGKLNLSYPLYKNTQERKPRKLTANPREAFIYNTDINGK
jgi:hypothetical protein